MSKVVVTRHPALVEYLIELGLITPETQVISHATQEEVQGKDVIGVLPLSLACLAKSITEIPLSLSPEDRGRELDIERIREIAKEPRTYSVQAHQACKDCGKTALPYERWADGTALCWDCRRTPVF